MALPLGQALNLIHVPAIRLGLPARVDWDKETFEAIAQAWVGSAYCRVDGRWGGGTISARDSGPVVRIHRMLVTSALSYN